MFEGTSFVDACLAGAARGSDIDDWVDRWHDAGGQVAGTVVSLDQFLGFSEEEGALWAEEPSSLRFIISAHRRRIPLDEVLSSQEEFALAARAGEPGADQKVLAWLQERGHLEPPE